MDKEIKETILKTLQIRKDRLEFKGNRNIQFYKKMIKEWTQELENKQKYSYSHVGGNIGIQMEIYEDNHKKRIKEFTEWVEGAEKKVADLDKAIEYVKKL